MQIYEETEKFQKNDEIDLLKLANDMWKAFCKYKIRFLSLIVLIAVIFTCVRILTYEPAYEAYATYVVSKNQAVINSSNNPDTIVANRLANTFKYVMENGGLEQRIRKKLGIVKSIPLPVTLTASAIEDTNLLTITAVSPVDTQAQQAMEVVLDNYPGLSYEIVGNCELTVIDQSGIIDTPSNPISKVLTILQGIGLGIFVDLVILFIMAYNNSTISSYEDLKKYLSVNCIGTIPLMKFKKRKKDFDTTISILNDKVPAAFRESINTLRTRIEKEMREKKLKSILVSSSIPGEGKTTISLNLAFSLKDRGKKVLVIDGDLRNPSVHQLVNINSKNIKYGISDVLTGKSRPLEAIIYNQDLGISMMLGRKSVGNASELLSSRNMQYLIEELSDYFDCIIVDTPPAAMMTDASVVAAYMDAVLYVIRQDYSKVNYISEGIGLLADSDTEVLGCVLNCAQAGFGSYGYGKYGKYGYGKYGYGSYGYGED